MADGLLSLPVSPQQRCPVDAACEVADLLAAEDAEADALADRLHDGALQALVVARYATDAAVRGADPALARDAVQEALVSLRRSVWLLRPRGGDDLPAALTELSKRAVAAGCPALDLAVDAAVAAQLPAACRTAAYRFVQAASLAGCGEVRLVRDGAYAALSVAGADLPQPTGWAVRAAALGGFLDRSGPTPRLLLPLLDDREDDR
ncbi:MAG: hypothetical protein EPN99_10205 [Frankiales bacterium]|nr:MAG: hypothetical protein EPN99_10205 [Frankiales bacterium]